MSADIYNMVEERSVVTLTFSPCIDKCFSVPALIPHVKLACSSPSFDPGGGGINVARAIKRLGGNALAICPAGGYAGMHFIQLLDREHVPVQIIETIFETRENIIAVDDSSHVQYRFGMPPLELTSEEWIQCLLALQAVKDPSYIVVSGSLPAGFPADLFSQISEFAKRKMARVIVDTSGDALKTALRAGVYLIKPNLGELGSLVGKKDLQHWEAADVARELILKHQCEIVIVSMGPEGALLVTADSREMITPPEVSIKSTVGAGDSMVAGVLQYLSMGKPIQEAVRYGVACGTAATMNEGTELCRREDVEKLFNEIMKQNFIAMN